MSYEEPGALGELVLPYITFQQLALGIWTYSGRSMTMLPLPSSLASLLQFMPRNQFQQPGPWLRGIKLCAWISLQGCPSTMELLCLPGPQARMSKRKAGQHHALMAKEKFALTRRGPG